MLESILVGGAMIIVFLLCVACLLLFIKVSLVVNTAAQIYIDKNDPEKNSRREVY
ncbi:hypothetical protein LPY66_15385 [Dehalobacter sp. DCM]|uniref:hypothetical protein n=1 Tax=Dehalobacter sp. DCM TaxID=2907827 RepID=UPI0030818954|nr:hypothetical protein LPY66_15385 [Dehalobacter sp. DCM]